MENLVGMILNAENVRMLALMVVGYCGYISLRGQFDKKIDGVESSLNKRIDVLEASLDKKIDEKLLAFHAMLKANDFAHLNNTIEALTFTLEKNGFLKREDKEYIDSRLDK